MMKLARVCAVLLACISAASAVADDDEKPLRLVVLLAVDGMSPAVVDRLDDLFDGGLRRLYTDGAVMSNCHQDHAHTLTGPGYFVLASGHYPGPAGVMGNSFYEPGLGKSIYCVGDSMSVGVGDEAASCSYRAINGSTLGDWMKTAWGDSKVFSIAGKDRAAVFMGGRSADGVYWFSRNTTEFVTSDYYEDARPEWLDAFNARDLAGSFSDMPWERVIADTALYRERARADRFAGERDFSSVCVDDPRNDPVFDHRMNCGTEDRQALGRLLYRTPFVDAITLDLAETLITAEELGTDDVPDLLCVGLSGLDGVSHFTGPYSQESMDTVLRLDREIGTFLDWLDDEIGPDAYTVLLTADHGFPPLPEYGAEVNVPARRVQAEVRAFIERVKKAIAAVTDEEIIARVDGSGFFLDAAAMRRASLTDAEVVAIVEKEAVTEDWIAWVKGRDELLEMQAVDPPADPVLRRHLNHLHPSRTPNVVVCFTPGVIYSSRKEGTTHGSPYDYDTHVPAVLLGVGVRPGVDVDAFTRTVDLMPTLAAILGIRPPDSVNGKPVSAAIARKTKNNGE